MLKKIKTVDDVRKLQPGDKFTIEYEVNRVGPDRVYVVPSASNLVVGLGTPNLMINNIIQRNGVVTFEAPFVPKPGENFQFETNREKTFRMVFMDDRSYVYETAIGARYIRSRDWDDVFVRA